MADIYRTTHYGLGAIGAGIARLAAQRPDVVPVAAADVSSALAGRDLYEIIGASGPAPVPIATDSDEALRVSADVVLHATGSYLPDVMPQLLSIVRAKKNVVSTCEELSYPWRPHHGLAKELDREARANGVTVLDTGINPGFVLDALALTLSAASQGVRRVELLRMVDVGRRREQLQRKVGVGLTPGEFEAKLATGRFGHVGSKESAWLVAQGLGWEFESLEETIVPVMGLDGRASGIRQETVGTVGGETKVSMVIQMSVGVERPRDEIIIEGEPHVHAVLEGGIMGDTGTAAVVINCIPRVVAHEPGLITMLDLPLVHSIGLR